MTRRSQRRILLPLILSVWACGSVLWGSFVNITALDPGEVTRIHCFPEDKTWRFSIFETDLAPTPKWDPQRTSVAPLTLEKAIDLALADVPNYVHDVDS